jgi:hypothetical protein
VQGTVPPHPVFRGVHQGVFGGIHGGSLPRRRFGRK